MVQTLYCSCPRTVPEPFPPVHIILARGVFPRVESVNRAQDKRDVGNLIARTERPAGGRNGGPARRDKELLD
jgi:hypothetical protein